RRDRVADPEAEDFGVEPGRAFQIFHIHPDMADLADAERQAFRTAHGLDGVDVHRVSSWLAGRIGDAMTGSARRSPVRRREVLFDDAARRRIWQDGRMGVTATRECPLPAKLECPLLGAAR